MLLTLLSSAALVTAVEAPPVIVASPAFAAAVAVFLAKLPTSFSSIGSAWLQLAPNVRGKSLPYTLIDDS